MVDNQWEYLVECINCNKPKIHNSYHRMTKPFWVVHDKQNIP